MQIIEKLKFEVEIRCIVLVSIAFCLTIVSFNGLCLRVYSCSAEFFVVREDDDSRQANRTRVFVVWMVCELEK